MSVAISIKPYKSFQLKPCYSEEPLVAVNAQKLEKLGKEEATRTILAELNDPFSSKFERNFVDSLVVHGGERLQVILFLVSPLLSLSLPPYHVFPLPLTLPIRTYMYIVHKVLFYMPMNNCIMMYNVHVHTTPYNIYIIYIYTVDHEIFVVKIFR